MLSNINRYLLLYLLIITILTVFGITIITIIKSFKQGKCNKCKTIFVALLCIIIVGLSWIFNMGWLRVIMTLVLIPFINAVIFLVINLIVSKYIDESNELKNINILFCLTYLLTYLLLPDAGDIGEMYVFFHLIHNNLFSYICGIISFAAFIGHIALLIFQIVELVKVKNNC